MEPRWDNRTRIALLDAAVDEIAEHRADVNVRRIARRAAVTYGSIRYWFGGRDLLLEEAVEHGMWALYDVLHAPDDASDDALDDALDDRAARVSPAMPLPGLVERLCERAEANPRPFLFVGGLVALVPVEPVLENRIVRHLARLESTVAASFAFRRRSPRAPDASDLDRAGDLFALFDGHLRRRAAGIGSAPESLLASSRAIVDGPRDES